MGFNYFAQPLSFGFPPKWDRTKNEMVVAHVVHGTACNIDLQIQIFIALAKVDVVDGQPAVAVFNKLVGKVESIVMAIEAEARRIGLFK